jgi:hypothetical protein
MSTLSEQELTFARGWARRDFSSWNENDIREEHLAPLLLTLGYAKGTVNDILREKTLALAAPYHRVGRKKVAIDYIPTVRLQGFWILEAKPGSPREMTFGDLLQAHLYAIHPEVQARLFALSNGWSMRIYDALTVKSWDDAIFTLNSLMQRRDSLGCGSCCMQRPSLLPFVAGRLRLPRPAWQ